MSFANPIYYKVVKKLGRFGWIYSKLSEVSDSNPIGRHRCFSGEGDNPMISDGDFKFSIAKGLFTIFYASVAAEYHITVGKGNYIRPRFSAGG